MSFTPHSLRAMRVRPCLLIGLLLSLCFSGSAGLTHLTTAVHEHNDSDSTVISDDRDELHNQGLTTTIVAANEGFAPTPYRTKRPLIYPAVLTLDRSVFAITTRCGLSFGTSAADSSSLSYSRFSGRAPPSFLDAQTAVLARISS